MSGRAPAGRDIRIDIDELVLVGWERLDHVLIGNALARELSPLPGGVVLPVHQLGRQIASGIAEECAP